MLIKQCFEGVENNNSQHRLGGDGEWGILFMKSPLPLQSASRDLFIN